MRSEREMEIFSFFWIGVVNDLTSILLDVRVCEV